MYMEKKGKSIWQKLNPFSDLIEARKQYKNLRKKGSSLNKELKDLEEKRKKVLYVKH
jgi:hypothetical protein